MQSRVLLRSTFLSLFLFVYVPLIGMSKSSAAETPQFRDTELFSDNGAVSVTWTPEEPPKGSQFQVKLWPETTKEKLNLSRVIYRGSLPSAFVSGLPGGEYQLKVRLIGDKGPKSAWSRPAHLTVKHHPLSFTFWLLGLGAIVTIATVGVILRGARS